MKLDTLELEFKVKVEKLIADVNAATGLNWVCVQGRRTIAEQNALYAQGRTAKGNIVTRAKGGQSAHNFGLAADLAPEKVKGIINWNAPDKLWKAMADIAVAQGLTAGYYFKGIHDPPHVEDPSWKTKQALWLAGKIKIQ